jgi:hypothetical protein
MWRVLSRFGRITEMPSEARVESETVGRVLPVILRSFEPVPDLDDRLQRVFAVLSLPPLEESSVQGRCVARSATCVTSDLAEP